MRNAEKRLWGLERDMAEPVTRGIREPDGHVTGDPAADESRGVRDRAGPCVPSRAFPPTCRMAFRSVCS